MTSVLENADSRAIEWAGKESLAGVIRHRVKPASVVLDVGCGIQPQTLVWPKLHLCVEVHGEYVDYLRRRFAGSPSHVVMHASWQDALRVLPDRSVDTVFALDFIEHLEKQEGFRFLDEASRVARRQVVVFTPLGYFPQSYDRSDARDRWGMHGGFWQTHRSGWVADDFPAEWEIVGCRDYHTRGQDGPLPNPVGCIWAIRTLDALSSVPGRDTSWLRRLHIQTMVYRYLPSRWRTLLAKWREARSR